MKLLRYGEPGYEKPALLAADGSIRDLSHVVPDIAGDALSPASIARLSALDHASLPVVPPGVRLGPCVGQVRNFIAVGLNYVDHALETNTPVPAEPVLFSKATTSLSGPDDPIRLLPGSEKTDWEVEIAFVMGREAFLVPAEDALSYVAGYAVCHDVSERALQIERGGQWIKGKSAPGFGPLGPWLVTTDEIADVQDLNLWLDVNGVRRQTGTTRKMIFPIAYLVSYITQFMKLMPGDIVTTGTPPGVGLGMKPPQFLKPGDVVTLGVTGLGTQRQTILEPESSGINLHSGSKQ